MCELRDPDPHDRPTDRLVAVDREGVWAFGEGLHSTGWLAGWLTAQSGSDTTAEKQASWVYKLKC